MQVTIIAKMTVRRIQCSFTLLSLYQTEAPDHDTRPVRLVSVSHQDPGAINLRILVEMVEKFLFFSTPPCPMSVVRRVPNTKTHALYSRNRLDSWLFPKEGTDFHKWSTTS